MLLEQTLPFSLRPKLEDVTVKMENLTPEQIENTIKQIRQRKEVTKSEP